MRAQCSTIKYCPLWTLRAGGGGQSDGQAVPGQHGALGDHVITAFLLPNITLGPAPTGSTKEKGLQGTFQMLSQAATGFGHDIICPRG